MHGVLAILSPTGKLSTVSVLRYSNSANVNICRSETVHILCSTAGATTPRPWLSTQTILHEIQKLD